MKQQKTTVLDNPVLSNDNYQNKNIFDAAILAETRKKEIEEFKAGMISDLIQDADKYNIPYNILDPNLWSYLAFKVNEYEGYLSQAEDLGIDWNIKNYDICELRIAIEEREFELIHEKRHNKEWGCYL